jgi:hypothetical protein
MTITTTMETVDDDGDHLRAHDDGHGDEQDERQTIDSAAVLLERPRRAGDDPAASSSSRSEPVSSRYRRPCSSPRSVRGHVLR